MIFKVTKGCTNFRQTIWRKLDIFTNFCYENLILLHFFVIMKIYSRHLFSYCIFFMIFHPSWDYFVALLGLVIIEAIAALLFLTTNFSCVPLNCCSIIQWNLQKAVAHCFMVEWQDTIEVRAVLMAMKFRRKPSSSANLPCMEAQQKKPDRSAPKSPDRAALWRNQITPATAAPVVRRPPAWVVVMLSALRSLLP
jgi:hypothetical protein